MRPDNDATATVLCRCGHPRSKHVFMRGRCAENCGCVGFEVARNQDIFETALTLDEQVELLRKENVRLTGLNRALLNELDGQVPIEDGSHKLRMKLEDVRRVLLQVATDPTSTRATVQGAILQLLERTE